MTAAVARCHFWWNNFFLLLSFSSFFFDYDYTAAADNNIHTYMQRQQRARKKNEVLDFFFFFFFYSVLLLYVWRRVCLYEPLLQLFFTERQNDKEENEGEMRWFRLLCLGKQQSIDLLFIIGHYSLLCSVYLSPSLSFFFVNSVLYAHALLCSPILVIAPCFTNTSTYVQTKRMMTVVPLYRKRKVLMLHWHVIYIKGENERKRNHTRTHRSELADIELCLKFRRSIVTDV